MMANLTHEEFSKHINTQFKVIFSDGELPLSLVEVKAYMPQENEQGDMERFSICFDGAANLMMPQGTYPLRHDQMGDFEVFLTPLSQSENAVRYEAVFNYYVTSDE